MLAPNVLLQQRYLIIRPIGQGGMGAVYIAKDQRLGSTVALKETHFSEIQMRRAFEREARLLANLRHPALPRVSDHFNEGDGQFLVMEFIPGEDLQVLLSQRGRPFPQETVVGWADQLLDALDYLHTREPPILHRDIKPANLKITERNQIILLDFGLAKGSVSEMSSVATSQSVLGFTPNFAPLEQIHGTGTDPRSDLYSLSATLYYLMTRKMPPDAVSRATARVSDEPDPLRPANEINLEVDEAVADVLKQAMALNPSQRPGTALDMRSRLQNAGTSLRFLKDDDPNQITLASTVIDKSARDLTDGQRLELGEDDDEPMDHEATRLATSMESSGRRITLDYRGFVALGGALLVALLIYAGIMYYPSNQSDVDPHADSQLLNNEITTASGLKYTDLVVGTGATPQKGQTVTVNYTGTLENGKKFDSSLDRGKPADFRIGVGMMIKGWDEGLLTMKVGGKRRLVIPPSLAYGTAGRPPDIPANSTLIFDVELLGTR